MKFGKLQEEKTAKIFAIMEKEFGIKLKVFHSIPLVSQDKSVQKIVPILQKLDPYVLTSVYTIATISKSSALALALIYRGNEELSLQEAVEIARLDINYQASIYGRVEGAHDFDDMHTMTAFATAKSLVNLC